MRSPTRWGVVAGLVVSAAWPATAPAWAHSPGDFLKVPVGVRSTVLLPPLSVAPGRVEVTLLTPARLFTVSAVSAGPHWQERVAPGVAVLDGRRSAAGPLLVTVTGTAHRAGGVPVVVRVSSPTAPTQTYQWTMTALAGYSRSTASDVKAARPDAAVALPPPPSPRLWPASIALALAAFGLLTVRRLRASPR